MTETHPLVRIGNSVFSNLPRPVLFLVSIGLVFMLGTDLLVPDMLPFLDEAVLAFLLYGSTSALLKRRQLGDGRPVTESLDSARLSKSLVSEAKELAVEARRLRRGGLPVQALDRIADLPSRAERLTSELKRSDAFLSRRENDPWQVRRGVEKLERAVVDAEVEGEARRRESLEQALEAARMHAAEVRSRSGQRDASVTAIQSLASQARTLLELLRRVEDDGAIPPIPSGMGDGWDADLARVVEELRDARVAGAELDEAMRPPRVPRRTPEG